MASKSRIYIFLYLVHFFYVWRTTSTHAKESIIFVLSYCTANDFPGCPVRVTYRYTGGSIGTSGCPADQIGQVGQLSQTSPYAHTSALTLWCSGSVA